MNPLIDKIYKSDHIICSNMIEYQEICLFKLKVMKIKLSRTVSKADNMNQIWVFRRLEGTMKDFDSSTISFLFELVETLQEDSSLLDLIHLTCELYLIIQPRIHRIVTQVNDSARPKLWRTILEQWLDHVVDEPLLLFVVNTF